MATDSAVLPETTPYRPDPTRHLWQVPTFLLGVAVFVGAWQGWLPLGTPDPTADFTRDLAALRASYEKVTPEREELKELLTKVAAGIDHFPEYTTTTHYALGCGYVRLAELSPSPEESRTNWTLAKQHFELITPEQLHDQADVPRLAFRAVKARVGAGLPANASQADLKLAITLLGSAPANEDPGDAHRLSAELSMRLSPPDLASAKESLTRYLTSAGIATPAASLARSRLQVADIHVRRNEHSLARKWLEQIGGDAPPEVLAPAKSLLAKVRMAEDDWLGAARDWETMRATPGVSPEMRASSAYYLGLCRLNTKELPVATKLFEEAAKGGDTNEARAASARLAELHLKGTENTKRSLVPELLAACVKGISARKDYANPLLPVTELQPVFELACSELNRDGDFEAAVKVAETYSQIAPVRSREKRAETLAAWATSSKNHSEFKPRALAAATEFEAIAATQPAATAKADILRRAAAMYRLAEEPEKTVAVLDAATKLTGLPDATVSLVWTEFAEALILAKRPEQAWPAFMKAMEGTNPASTALRYRLGRQFIDTHKAEYVTFGRNLFEQIAKQERVEPGEQEHHELALVGLGYEVMRGNNYPEAEVWLRKQIALYPTGSEAGLGRLFLGICLLQRATVTGASAPDAASVTRMREDAVKLFKQVVTEADAKQKKEGKLGERDSWIRIQAGLRVLQTYQQMQKPNDLLAEASTLLERHRNTVDELIILSLVYHAFKQKNESGRALQTRDQMRELFERLPASAFPAKNGEYSRGYWEKVWFAPEPK